MAHGGSSVGLNVTAPDVTTKGAWPRVQSFMVAYVRKYKGSAHKLHPFPKKPTIPVLVSTFIGAFCGILIVAVINDHAPHFENGDLVMFIASFGASSALVYGAIDSPLAQPRNTIGGSVLSAISGVSMAKAFRNLPDYNFVATALAVAIALNLMQITRTMHPPGGATAAIAVTGSAKVKNLGFLYVIFPVLIGECILVAVALLINNVAREYPLYWYRPKKRLLTNAPQDTLVPSVRTIERHVHQHPEHGHAHADGGVRGDMGATGGGERARANAASPEEYEMDMRDIEREASDNEEAWERERKVAPTTSL